MRTQELNQRELELGVPPEASWHQDYKDSSYIYVGNLPQGLTEGDLIIIFSQFGTPIYAQIARDKRSGNALGHAHICYEDQRSTILAVDNFDGVELLGKRLKVDHSHYKAENNVPLHVLYNEPEGLF